MSDSQDLEIAEARLRWKRRFRERVELIKRLLTKHPQDNTPTPRPIDDD